MENTTKLRTPSRCREWERQRRNRFNEALTKLGEVVKEIIKNDTKSESADNVQYPKIEIVQKAIFCLTTCAQEKTQLKAEILALQVKLEAEKSQKPDKKDASIQVSAIVYRKNKNGKYVKLLTLQKSNNNELKEKNSITTIDVSTDKTESKCVQENTKSCKTIQKLPKLLPLTNNVSTKKGSENTIMMFSGTPYMFPQRPLLFPAVPPAIVFLDSNAPNINKPSTIPIINRNNGDMTKTTMVNILPISAYTHSLSATKHKKSNRKSRLVQKKNNKIIKQVSDTTKDTANSSKEIKMLTNNEIKCDETIHVESDKKLTTDKSSDTIIKVANKSKDTVDANNESSENGICKTGQGATSNKSMQSEKPKISEANHDTTVVPISSIVQKPSEITNLELREVGAENSRKPDKVSADKNILLDEKDKENKLPNLLDTGLCDNVVDGGNARLELAEEFLAASPTAAFLMSFPLVSGNRADSPADDHSNLQTNNSKENTQRRNDVPPPQPIYFSKLNNVKAKSTKSSQNILNITQKPSEQQKFINNVNIQKQVEPKISNIATVTNASNDNPFLNLSMPSIISTCCTITDGTYSLDFDCNISKANQSVNVVSGNNFFYKSDPLNTTKNSIYSTSNISSGHEFNGIGLYPCAMEKFSTKNKPDFSNMEDNLMKIGPSRLTYDIDLGWSHKGFDFVACTTNTSTFNKDNILATTPTQYSTSYNPFNPEFHVPLVANSNRKDNVSSKAITSFPETITSFYSQPTNLWSEEMSFYSSNNFSKNFPTKPQNFASIDQPQINTNHKTTAVKQYETKQISNITTNHNIKPVIEGPPIATEKYTKKSPSKMHINWMTSEIRPMQNNCNPNQTSVKENHKALYTQNNIIPKKQDPTDGNYFPINMHNFPSQVTQEEFQVWPTARPAGTTEISIEPPPINLPTLVGDLALGPEKKKNEAINRVLPQSDLQNCNNFFSVTQLMNRSSDVMPSRYQGPIMEPKLNPKQNVPNMGNESRKSRLEAHLSQPCYVFNEPKAVSYETIGHFSQTKAKNNKTDKSSKNQKTSYSAEALIRGGPCNQKTQDAAMPKFMLPPQKFNDFNVTQDSGVAQVSHFPPLLEYPENTYTSQQFSGTTLYNSTTNTISNSFYSNFMPGSGNLMSSNYASGPFQSEFIDYNQPATDCNYPNYKYEDLKMKVNSTALLQEKPPSSQYKGSRRETAAKHKLECSKKESSKKCNSKRAKLTNEVEEWTDSTHLLWQSKTPTKRHPNISDDLAFPNYVGNQMSASSQYQPEFFNTHLMPPNMQNVNIDRTLTSIPPTSRANFNLSTIFPEITMKVQ